MQQYAIFMKLKGYRHKKTAKKSIFPRFLSQTLVEFVTKHLQFNKLFFLLYSPKVCRNQHDSSLSCFIIPLFLLLFTFRPSKEQIHTC
mgnify:CR=1 FL=1